MTSNEFIEQMKASPNWDEAAYQEWLEETSPSGTDLEKRKQFLDTICEAENKNYTTDDVNDWIEANVAAGQGLLPTMEFILYQFYIVWLEYVRGIQYI